MVDIENTVTSCAKCEGAVVQDPDTFDTWFSSGQWPLCTTGYPDSDDFKNYYPTSVMETGKDIIFFWVSRMVMLGLYRTSKVPFEKVYLHGMVRDKHGKKMSKSKGNVIAPSEIQEKYGTDALRMGLIVNNVPGADMNLDPDKVNAYKKFANKLWNITRFVLDNTKVADGNIKFEITDRDKARELQLKNIILLITEQMEKERYDLASEMLYHFIWDDFANDIIEESKPLLSDSDLNTRISRQALLGFYLNTSLRLLHPFMPFITETIWQELPNNMKTEDILMIEKWPSGGIHY
jgi:valyl-tRNA synthetase